MQYSYPPLAIPLAVCCEINPCARKSVNLTSENVDEVVVGVAALGVIDGVVTVLASLKSRSMAIVAATRAGAAGAPPFDCCCCCWFGPFGLRWRW